MTAATTPKRKRKPAPAPQRKPAPGPILRTLGVRDGEVTGTVVTTDTGAMVIELDTPAAAAQLDFRPGRRVLVLLAEAAEDLTASAGGGGCW